jgi:hypothetical protein
MEAATGAEWSDGRGEEGGGILLELNKEKRKKKRKKNL